LHKHGNRHNPALSISIGRNGAILLHCHGGCSLEDICDALGIPVSALFPGPLTPEIKRAMAERRSAEERRAIERRTITNQIKRLQNLARALARELVEAPVNAITDEKERQLHRVLDKVGDLETELGRVA
jgi:hypothetical protein